MTGFPDAAAWRDACAADAVLGTWAGPWPTCKMVGRDAQAVATLLVELGRRTALAGNNYFRARAYLRAADSLLALPEPPERVIAENRLRQLPGIGETIANERRVEIRPSMGAGLRPSGATRSGGGASR
ncbi:MAG: helix-hairpin-helix domain-containing protein [Stellaceae bacterium]